MGVSEGWKLVGKTLEQVSKFLPPPANTAAWSMAKVATLTCEVLEAKYVSEENQQLVVQLAERALIVSRMIETYVAESRQADDVFSTFVLNYKSTLEDVQRFGQKFVKQTWVDKIINSQAIRSEFQDLWRRLDALAADHRGFLLENLVSRGPSERIEDPRLREFWKHGMRNVLEARWVHFWDQFVHDFPATREFLSGPAEATNKAKLQAKALSQNAKFVGPREINNLFQAPNRTVEEVIELVVSSDEPDLDDANPTISTLTTEVTRLVLSSREPALGMINPTTSVPSREITERFISSDELAARTAAYYSASVTNNESNCRTIETHAMQQGRLHYLFSPANRVTTSGIFTPRTGMVYDSGLENSFDWLDYVKKGIIKEEYQPVTSMDSILDQDQAPTHLKTDTIGRFLSISSDKLSVRYAGLGLDMNDVGAVQGNQPVPRQRFLYYFEVFLKNTGRHGKIGIGFTDENFSMDQQPGWGVNSCGYHGDDGKLFLGHTWGEDFGPTCVSGDTVGAGINFISRKFFFTRNGKLVGQASNDTECRLYPTIGLHSPGENVELNFGLKRFLFDVDSLAQKERDLVQDVVERLPLPCGYPEDEPTCLNTVTCGSFVTISSDKISAAYTGRGENFRDVGVIQGNHPASTQRIVFYFEVFIVDNGRDGKIAIGFTDKSFEMRRQPGWELNSCGYHGDDGKLFLGSGAGEDFGPTFTTGDIVGAGINFVSQKFFFTKNGKLIGEASKTTIGLMYPTIGLHSPHESVKVNFGQEPFLFNVDTIIRKELGRLQRAVDRMPNRCVEIVPTEFNTSAYGCRYLIISSDKLAARYTGRGQNQNDVGAIKSDHPAPRERIVYYFEMSVKEKGRDGKIAIGFAGKKFKTSRQPGWELNSCGYHGDDGRVFQGHGSGEDFGPTFSTGDVVGAGIDYVSRKFFFTRNGMLIGTITKDTKGPMYPAIGLHSPGEAVEVNFGSKPFVFDVEMLIRKELGRVKSMSMPSNWDQFLGSKN